MGDSPGLAKKDFQLDLTCIPRPVNGVKPKSRVRCSADLDSLNRAAWGFCCMAAMNTCSCGWTIISPIGAEDCAMHTMIHLKEHHPGTVMSREEIMAHVKEL